MIIVLIDVCGAVLSLRDRFIVQHEGDADKVDAGYGCTHLKWGRHRPRAKTTIERERRLLSTAI